MDPGGSQESDQNQIMSIFYPSSMNEKYPLNNSCKISLASIGNVVFDYVVHSLIVYLLSV